MKNKIIFLQLFILVGICFFFALTKPASAFVSDTTPPSDPQNLGVALGTDCTAKLEWQGSADFFDPLGVSYTVFANGVNIATATSTPYTVTKLLPHTAYVFTVQAQDSSGNKSGISNTASYTTDYDTTKPFVDITFPNTGAIIKGITTFTATSTDNVEVAKVQFLIDGQNYSDAITVSPYSINFNADNYQKNSSHNLTAQSYDTSGNIGVSRTINFTIGDITAPAPYAISVGQITYTSAVISWQTNTGVTGAVKYGLSSTYDKQVQESGLTSSHMVSLTGLTRGQTYHYSVQSILSGYTTATSTDATFTTLDTPATDDTTPPVVSLMSPSFGSQVTGTTNISVSALDPFTNTQQQSGLGSVWLKIDGTNYGSALYSSPFNFSWNTALYNNGSHTVSIFAQDNIGNIASTTATYIVSNDLATQTANAHPDGSLILDGSTVYLIKNGKRAAFRDSEEYKSFGYKFTQAVNASSQDKLLPLQTEVIKALEGTLVLDKADNKTVYMIGTNGTKRGFASEAVFKNLGYKFENLARINLSDYPSGAVIASGTETHPDGALVLEGKTVWWIRGGQKQGFESLEVFNTYGFSLSKIVPANSADLALPTGTLVKFRDGTLISQNGNYYIISNGQKIQFTSQNALTSRGYNLSNAISADISSYTLGANLQ